MPELRWQAEAQSSFACRHARGAALREPCDSACSVPSRTSRVAELKQALSQQGQQAHPLALAPHPTPGRGRVAQLLKRLSTQTAPSGGTRSGRPFGRLLRQKLGRWVGACAQLAAVCCGRCEGACGGEDCCCWQQTRWAAGHMQAPCLRW